MRSRKFSGINWFLSLFNLLLLVHSQIRFRSVTISLLLVRGASSRIEAKNEEFLGGEISILDCFLGGRTILAEGTNFPS